VHLPNLLTWNIYPPDRCYTLHSPIPSVLPLQFPSSSSIMAAVYAVVPRPLDSVCPSFPLLSTPAHLHNTPESPGGSLHFPAIDDSRKNPRCPLSLRLPLPSPLPSESALIPQTKHLPTPLIILRVNPGTVQRKKKPIVPVTIAKRPI
jgi:hypothetical protein